MTVTRVQDGPQSGWFTVKIEGEASAAAVSLGSILNPEGVKLQITDGFLHTTVSSDGASTLDIGIGATGADSTDMCSAYDIDAAAAGDVIYVIGKDAASEAAATTPKGVDWGATEYLNFYKPDAAASTNYEGYLFLRYIRVGDYS